MKPELTMQLADDISTNAQLLVVLAEINATLASIQADLASIRVDLADLRNDRAKDKPRATRRPRNLLAGVRT